MERRKLIAVGAADAELRLVGEAAGSAWELTAHTRGEDAQAAVVFADKDAPERVATLLRAHPSMRVVVVLRALDRDTIVRAMRAGASDVLVMPVSSAEIAASLTGPGRDGAQGKMWGVLGAAGGLGVTTLAVNLADALARRGTPSALADLDVELGTVAQFLDLKPRFTIADVARNAARLDAAYLGGTLHAMPSTLRVLPAPLRIEEADDVTVDRVRSLLEAMRGTYSQVVLDLPRSANDRTLEALDRCDDLLLLVPLDVPGLAAAKRLRELFGRLNYRLGKTRLIAARAGRKGDVRLADAQRVLGVPFFHSLPDDPAAARGAMNLGKPLADAAPRSPLATAIAALAEKLVPSPRRAPRRGLFDGLHVHAKEG